MIPQLLILFIAVIAAITIVRICETICDAYRRGKLSVDNSFLREDITEAVWKKVKKKMRKKYLGRKEGIGIFEEMTEEFSDIEKDITELSETAEVIESLLENLKKYGEVDSESIWKKVNEILKKPGEEGYSNQIDIDKKIEEYKRRNESCTYDDFKQALASFEMLLESGTVDPTKKITLNIRRVFDGKIASEILFTELKQETKQETEE